MKLDIIYNEDCLKGVKRLPDESIDLIPTDPPYGIKFMGKSWDKALPDIKIWQECLRVLKPGAFAFVMCIPRQDCLARMIVSLEDAGFNVSFTSIYWAYASGFPKAQNIGKAVDKRRSCDVSGYINESGKTDKEIANYCEVSPALVRFWRLNERQIQLDEWNKLKRFLGIQNIRFDVNLLEAEREIIGKHPQPAREIYQSGKLPSDVDITLPATPQAQALDGSYSGFQPKPSVEIVIVAMKPLSEKTYVDQALKNRKGITWLDNCRVPYKSQDDFKKNWRKDKGSKSAFFDNANGKGIQTNSEGRFPSHLLVSDDALNDGKNYKSGWTNKDRTTDVNNYNVDIGGARTGQTGGHYSDDGSFSRYFSLDAWWEEKLKEIPEGLKELLAEWQLL